MNKQKTYTVEECKHDKAYWSGDECWFCPDCMKKLEWPEPKVFINIVRKSDHPLLEVSKPCIRCDMGGSEHPHVEEIRLLNPKEPSSSTDVYEYIDYKIAKKVDELIRSHNTLLKQMKGNIR